MRILIDEAAPEPSPEVLLVLLTGTYSQPEDFIREGFVAAVRQRGLGPEIALVGTPASQFADGTIADGLHHAVVAPARARGRSRIWLAGISLGGLAALSYAARHESELEGIVLLAPYPGTRDITREIDKAGGLAAWRCAAALSDDAEREAWRWLSSCRDSSVAVSLYCGDSDRFAEGQRRMGEALLPEHVHRLPGAHDWPTWCDGWNRFLDGYSARLRAKPRAMTSAPSRQTPDLRA